MLGNYALLFPASPPFRWIIRLKLLREFWGVIRLWARCYLGFYLLLTFKRLPRIATSDFIVRHNGYYKRVDFSIGVKIRGRKRDTISSSFKLRPVSTCVWMQHILELIYCKGPRKRCINRRSYKGFIIILLLLYERYQPIRSAFGRCETTSCPPTIQCLLDPHLTLLDRILYGTLCKIIGISFEPCTNDIYRFL